MGRFAPCKLAKLLHAPSEPVGKKFGTNAADHMILERENAMISEIVVHPGRY
jgi:hypothetical protein